MRRPGEYTYIGIIVVLTLLFLVMGAFDRWQFHNDVKAAYARGIEEGQVQVYCRLLNMMNDEGKVQATEDKELLRKCGKQEKI